MDDRTMRNWGVAATAGALGIALLVGAQGERSPNAPPASPTAPAPLPDDPAAPGGAVRPNEPIPAVGGAGARPADPKAPPATSATPKPTDAKPTPAVVSPAGAGDEIGLAVNPNLEFIVRFQGQSGLAKAQAQYAAGDHRGAAVAARAALAANPALKGLCFSKFTLGAEMVLAHCQKVPQAQLRAVSDRWTRRLNSMGEVDYADANVIVSNENPVRAPR